MPTRTYTRDQLEELGLPFDCASEKNAADYPGAAIELHCKQVGTRRWVSVHELVFRAPDDGKAYQVFYERGLTESQDGTDPWSYATEVAATEMEQVTVEVTKWQAVA